MSSAKWSAQAPVTDPVGADQFLVIDSGVSRRLTLDVLLNSFIDPNVTITNSNLVAGDFNSITGIGSQAQTLDMNINEINNIKAITLDAGSLAIPLYTSISDQAAMDGQTISEFIFNGNTDTTVATYANLKIIATNTTGVGTLDGQLVFDVRDSSGLTPWIILNNSGNENIEFFKPLDIGGQNIFDVNKITQTGYTLSDVAAEFIQIAPDAVITWQLPSGITKHTITANLDALKFVISNANVLDINSSGIDLRDSDLQNAGQIEFQDSTAVIRSTSNDIELVAVTGGVKADGDLVVTRRLQTAIGTDLNFDSATLTLGNGNTFLVTAATVVVNLINSTGWVDGSTVTLIFTTAAEIAEGGTSSDPNFPIRLKSGSNIEFTNNDSVTLVFDDNDGLWREINRNI